jgi:hypothetical protein
MDSVSVRSHGNIRPALVALGLILVLLFAAAVISLLFGRNTGNSLLTQDQSQPLRGVTTARVEIDPGDGNLTVDPLASGEPVLVSASLQYLEKQGLPLWSTTTSDGQTVLSLKANKGSGQPWLRLPWEACNGATDWQIHLNPAVVTDLQAHTAGGNMMLNLTGFAIRHVSAETGGGNVTVVLSSGLTGSSTIEASSGAGNVEVQLPEGTAARIHATTGMGKIILDKRFNKMDDTTYQTSDYETSANKIEITLKSGAGNVSVTTK